MLPIQKALIQSIFIVPIMVFKCAQYLVGTVITDQDKREMKQSVRNFGAEFREKATYTVMDIHTIMRYVIYIGVPICLFAGGLFTYMDTFSEAATHLESRIYYWSSLVMMISLGHPVWQFVSGNYSARSSVIDYFILLIMLPFLMPLIFGALLRLVFWLG